MSRRRGGALFLALGLAALSGCGGGAPSPERPRRPNVFFLSLDTVRRDRVGVYRPDVESLTPNLDAFAADAVRFDAAFVQMPFTLPSHMSMFTGLYPGVHGVSRPNARLAPAVPTLPEVLHGRGYATFGWVTNSWMKGEFGFARGFDNYQELRYGLTFADRVDAKALAQLDRLDLDRAPVFLFLHYLDAHSDFHQATGNTLPYYAPEPYRRPLVVDENSPEFCDGQGRCATDFLLAADHEGTAVAPEEVERISALYDGGIRYLDAQLGELFAELKRRGLYRDALIVVTSDHGEEFREHGLFLHSQTYDESIAVPLLIKLPGGEAAGEVVGGLVESVDLMPTILDLVDAATPPGVQGQSLLPAIRGAGGGKEAVLSQDKLHRTRYALRTADLKLIYDFAGGQAELYDLTADPGETRNLAITHPADPRLAELRRRLAALVRANRAAAVGRAAGGGQKVLDAEEERRLKAIGYVE